MLTARFAAFISYNHADRRHAEWLHRALESWQPPSSLELPARSSESVGTAKNPLKPVFIDRAELSTSTDLAASVRDALQRADALIVICSPAAALSRWVNEEVLAFKALGRASRVFCLVVAGEPATGDCFPPAIRLVVTQDGVQTDQPAPEPLAADLRTGKDSRADALNKLVAGLLDLPLDQLRQRDAARRQKRMMLVTAASVVGCLIFGLLSVGALLAKREADLQRANAERESLTARRTADFMKSLFAVSDPGEARGNSITAREVLDRGVQQIAQQLDDTPLVRADLRATLGEVYASLGLLTQGRQLLQAAATTPGKPSQMSARVFTALGELDYRRGDYDVALASLNEAEKWLAQADAEDIEVRTRLFATLGDIHFSKDDMDAARRFFQQALESARRMNGLPARLATARATHGLAQVDLIEGDDEAAVKGFETALSEQIAISGELHPLVSDILNNLGALEYGRQRPAAAEAYWRRCLAIDRKLLGDRHPSTAPSLNNLARVLLEQRQFAESRRLLEESIDIRRTEVLETADEMAFAFSNHALTLAGLGDARAAEPEFIKALRAATLHKHRLLAPIMTDLADLECRSDRVSQGIERLKEARPLMAERYPDDPWRVALVDNVRAGCLGRQGHHREAAALIESSTPVLLARWNAGTLYGHDSLRRAIVVYERSGDAAQAARYRGLAEQRGKQ
jgi:tetratricopeptide (TPR) repeat protein